MKRYWKTDQGDALSSRKADRARQGARLRLYIDGQFFGTARRHEDGWVAYDPAIRRISGRRYQTLALAGTALARHGRSKI